MKPLSRTATQIRQLLLFTPESEAPVPAPVLARYPRCCSNCGRLYTRLTADKRDLEYHCLDNPRDQKGDSVPLASGKLLTQQCCARHDRWREVYEYLGDTRR